MAFMDVIAGPDPGEEVAGGQGREDESHQHAAGEQWGPMLGTCYERTKAATFILP
jgi:hypothetical protein